LYVKEAAFDLKAWVRAGLAGEDVRVVLHHWHDGKDFLGVARTYPPLDQPVPISRRVELRPGHNKVTVVALNGGARPGREGEETDSLELDVIYVKKDPPPEITFTGARPRSGARGQESLLEGDVPRVRLTGKVKGLKRLVRAEWSKDASARPASLTGFAPNRQVEFDIREDLVLEPGLQTFSFRAQADNSDEARHALTVVYRPRLPTLALTWPPSGTTVLGDKEVGQVALQGRIDLPREAPLSAGHQAYRAAILVNGRELPGTPRIDERAGTVKAEVPVRPGSNTIQVRLSNSWGSDPKLAETDVVYLRPPVIRGLKAVRAGGRRAVDLEARVWSPLPLLGPSVQVEVNGQESRVGSVSFKEAGGGEYVVRLGGVTLEAGRKENVVRFRVANAEAMSPPGQVTVETERVFPPPVVTFSSPPESQSSPRLTVRFQVRSASRLEAVELLRDQAPPLPIDLSAARRDETGGYELATGVEIDLPEGISRLRVRAVNEGGQRITEPPLVVNYIPPPMRLVIDSLVPDAAGEVQPVPARRQPHGRLSFPEVGTGRAKLRGRILWGDAGGKRRNRNAPLRVYVNGFQQVPAHFRPEAGGPRETPFEATLLLRRKKENHVSLVLPGQDPDEFSLDCGAPVTGQRLHLLVLNTRERGRPDPSRFRTHAFADVQVYGPLVGFEVRRLYLFHQLDNIRDRIADLADVQKPLHDVVIVYYRGGEALGEEGNLFETNAGAARQFDIKSDQLVKELADTPGAHVLLLDVDREGDKGPARPEDPRDKIGHWEREYLQARQHVGVLRYAWVGKGAEPGNARLVVALEKALPQAVRLGELVALMGRMVESFQKSPGLLIAEYIPNDLKDLLVNASP
jgi:hypothetical protein